MSTAVRPDHVTTQLRESVEQELSAFFASKHRIAQGYGTDFAHLWNLASQHAQGGKLLRPVLLLEAYDALTAPGARVTGSTDADAEVDAVDRASARKRDQAVTIAAAVEVLHYAFLLHDDVIDGDVIRRGRANLVGELAAMAQSRTRADGAQHWGHTGGILIGDLLLSATHQLFARIDVDAASRIRLLDLLEHTIVETTAGEYADVGLSHGVVETDLSTVLTMTTRKTASYTFELPLRAAVILADGSHELEETLSVAGSHLGLAYQLQDDQLSTFGDSVAHGKDPYSDLREGKQTAIMSYARMTSAWPSIEAAFGDPHLTVETAQHLRTLLVDCGAQRFVQGLIDEQMAAFYEVLASRGAGERIPAPLKAVLLDLATRLEGRQA